MYSFLYNSLHVRIKARVGNLSAGSRFRPWVFFHDWQSLRSTMASQSMGELRWWNNPRVALRLKTNEELRTNLERLVSQIHVRIYRMLEREWVRTSLVKS